MATLLTKGTATRSATQIAHEIEALGGGIGAGAGWDGTTLVVVGQDRPHRRRRWPCSPTSRRHPTFAADEIERARTQAIDDAGIALTDPQGLARMTATKAVFGDTTYGHVAERHGPVAEGDHPRRHRRRPMPGGRPGERDADLHRRHRPRRRGGAGDARRSATGPAPTAPRRRRRLHDRSAATYPAPRTIVVDLPGAAQASVVVARPGLARGDPAYYPAIVANAALGGGFSSRLNSEIRVKRGLAYGAGQRPRRAARRRLADRGDRDQERDRRPRSPALIAAEMKRLATTPVAGGRTGRRRRRC